MAAETWGVNQAYIQSMAATLKVSDDTGSLLTTARLAVVTKAAASDINGIITGVWGDGAVESFASDTAHNTYARIQALVWLKLEPMLMKSVHGLVPVADEMRDLEVTIRQKVLDLKAAPADLGDTDDSTYGGRAMTSTDGLGIDTTTQRAAYDGWDNPTSGRRRKYW